MEEEWHEHEARETNLIFTFSEIDLYASQYLNESCSCMPLENQVCVREIEGSPLGVQVVGPLGTAEIQGDRL
jgi:hypothetical protein